MKSIPFNTDMVRATLDNRKTVTRRPIKLKPIDKEFLDKMIKFDYGTKRKLACLIEDKTGEKYWEYTNITVPFLPGEIVYVKETYVEMVFEHLMAGEYTYKADTDSESERIRQEYIKSGFPYKWKPSIFMPESAARIFLEIISCTPERVLDITEEDAKKEGVPLCYFDGEKVYEYNGGKSYEYTGLILEESHKPSYKTGFIGTWDSIYAKKGHPFEKNGWVWRTEYKVKEVKR